MSDWKKYCEKVKEFKYHKLMEELEKIDLVNKNAIELVVVLDVILYIC